MSMLGTIKFGSLVAEIGSIRLERGGIELRAAVSGPTPGTRARPYIHDANGNYVMTLADAYRVPVLAEGETIKITLHLFLGSIRGSSITPPAPPAGRRRFWSRRHA
jgi:hypothetical protein